MPIAAGGKPIPDNIAEVAVLVVKEVMVGSAIGFSVSLVFSAVQFAGGLIDLTVGFAFANVVDPLQNTQISIVGQLYSLLATAVFLTIGGPHGGRGAAHPSTSCPSTAGRTSTLSGAIVHASAGCSPSAWRSPRRSSRCS